MSNWGNTHSIRMNALRQHIEEKIRELNKDVLHLPPRFKLVLNDEGRDLRLVDDTEKGD